MYDTYLFRCRIAANITCTAVRPVRYDRPSGISRHRYIGSKKVSLVIEAVESRAAVATLMQPRELKEFGTRTETVREVCRKGGEKRTIF